MIKGQTIALIAHDRRKFDMVNWVSHNAGTLCDNNLICTGNTGKLVEEVLQNYIEREDYIDDPVIHITKVASGPMGGDAEIAALVVQKEIDLCIFMIDDLSANPHEADIQMLLRQCRIHNIPVACNRATADYILTSSLWSENYMPDKPNYIEL